MAEQSCENCLYSEGETLGTVLGYRCRRNAPAPLPIEHEIMPRWPLVLDTDWCGQWAPREDEQ